MDCFIIQIYHAKEYDSIHELGFDYIIYTLYKATDYEKEITALLELAQSHDLVGITFPKRYIKKFGEDFYGPLMEAGIPLYIHTENDTEEMAYYLNLGIDAIYTDNVEGNDVFRKNH